MVTRRFPFVDVNRGQITATIQWGALFPTGGLGKDQTYAVTLAHSIS